MQQDFPSIQDDVHVVVVEVVALRPTVEFPEARVVVIVGRRAPAVHVVVVVVQSCLVSGKIFLKMRKENLQARLARYRRYPSSTRGRCQSCSHSLAERWS